MTQSFSDMLYLFSCAAHGVQPEKNPDMDFDEICRKAASQGILPMVLLSIKELNIDGEVIIGGASLDDHLKRLRYQALKNIQRSVIISSTIKQLFENGISCCVLKGDTLAPLYNKPDFRISSDTDIYIDANEETIDKSIKIFEENGFEFSGDPPNSHHFCAYHKTAGVLELHRSLYKELFNDVWFDNKTSLTEPYRTVTSPVGCLIPALGITDGLIYTYLHMVKHFLRGGIGVRPLMDVLLYNRKYKREIDFERFLGLIRHLRFEKFFECMLYIGARYFDFDYDDLHSCSCNEKTAGEILTDMEHSGLFGQNEAWRDSFYSAYNEQRFHTFKNEDYDEYMKAWSVDTPYKRPLLNKLKKMGEASSLAKYGLFVPAAWLHKTYMHNKKTHYSDKTRERLDLIRVLDMI